MKNEIKSKSDPETIGELRELLALTQKAAIEVAEERDRLRAALKDSHDVLLAIVKKAYLRAGKHEDYHVHPALVDAARLQVKNVANTLDEGGK